MAEFAYEHNYNRAQGAGCGIECLRRNGKRAEDGRGGRGWQGAS
jgi:hypothetical protein